MYTEEAEEALLGGRPDFVLDAIDNINTKVSSTAYTKRLVQRQACTRPCMIRCGSPPLLSAAQHGFNMSTRCIGNKKRGAASVTAADCRRLADRRISV